MAKENKDVIYNDKVAEQRAKDALRRALSTPYKPQREMVGKSDRPTPPQKKHRAKSSPKAP